MEITLKSVKSYWAVPMSNAVGGDDFSEVPKKAIDGTEGETDLSRSTNDIFKPASRQDGTDGFLTRRACTSRTLRHRTWTTGQYRNSTVRCCRDRDLKKRKKLALSSGVNAGVGHQLRGALNRRLRKWSLKVAFGNPRYKSKVGGRRHHYQNE